MNVLNASNTLRFKFKHEDFVDYVFFFYRDFPQYCSNKTPYKLWEVERAVKRYYKNIHDFDSIDRENVKAVIEAYRQAKTEQSYPKVNLFDKKIMANFVNGYTMTNYNLYKAMYQSINHEVSLRKESAC